MLSAVFEGRQGISIGKPNRTLRVGQSEYSNHDWFDLMDEDDNSLGYIYLERHNTLDLVNILLKQLGAGIEVVEEDIVETKVIGSKLVAK